MSNSQISLLSILVLFFMLWAPLGQYDFLVENWMKLGIYAAPFLLLGFFSQRETQISSVVSDLKLISILMLLAYLLHQYEEHWIDLFGNQYAFYDSVNQMLLNLLDAQNQSILPLSRAAIFIINTSLVWLVGAIAIWRSPNHLFPTLAMAGITLVNAVSHITLAVITQSYNPGLVTAIMLFIPLSIIFYWSVLIKNTSLKGQIIISIVWAILAHILMVAGLLGANWFQLFPELVYFLMLITWSLIPAFLYNIKTEIITAAEASE